MAGDGGWWCCCSRSCVIDSDNFDRENDTTDIGNVLEECPASGSGDWDIKGSTHAKYVGDKALYEESGTGVVLTRKRDSSGSHSASYQIIDEQQGNRYQIWLHVVDLHTCHPGAALMAELYIGDGDADPHRLTIYLIAEGGGASSKGTKTFKTFGLVDGQDGRRFEFSYVRADQLACAAVSHTPPTAEGRGRVVAQEVDAPHGTRAGIGNNSGIPIEIDDFAWLRLYGDNGPGVPQTICFSCMCRCQENETKEVLFPRTMHLRWQGQCCTAGMFPCNSSTCYGAIDQTIDLVFTPDYPEAFTDSWVGQVSKCGVLFEFRFNCLKLYICWSNDGGSTWTCLDDLTAQPNGPIELQAGTTCDPVSWQWKQTLLSLNQFPCCVSGSDICTGEYTYTMTE